MTWIGAGLLAGITLAATPRELRRDARLCERQDAPACLRLSHHAGTAPEAAGFAARACELGYAPGCVHFGQWSETRLSAPPVPARALEVLIAFERGCTLGAPESCAAASRIAVAHAELLHLSNERQLALHDAACRADTPSACQEAAVIRALAGPGRRVRAGGINPAVARREAAILACYEGVSHTKIATYKSMVRIAAYGSARRVRVDDAGPYGACLAEAFADYRPTPRTLTVRAFAIAVRISGDQRHLADAGSPVVPPAHALQDEIDATLEGAPFDGCFQDEAVRAQTPGGTMTVRFTITGDGRVRDAHATSAELPAPRVAACVRDIVNTLRFPRPASQRPIQVEHVIQFRPW